MIGTGSSGIQAIPVIAEQAAHVTVFQRTPNYSTPSQRTAGVKQLKTDYAQHRACTDTAPTVFCSEKCQSALDVTDEERCYLRTALGRGDLFPGAFNDLVLTKRPTTRLPSSSATKCAKLFMTPKLPNSWRLKTIPSPPSEFVWIRGISKPITAYCNLVDVSERPIETLTQSGLSVGGRNFEFDAIVFATGFDAMTNFGSRHSRRNGVSLG